MRENGDAGMELNERIRSIRTETGMNRKDFAEHFGIPLRTVEDWEANRRKPPEYIPRLLYYQWRYERIAKDSVIGDMPKNRNVDIVTDTAGNL